MSIHNVITDKEEFIKQEENYIDREIADIIKFAKIKLRETIEAGTFDHDVFMWSRNNFMAASVLIYVAVNDQIPLGMGEDFKRICKTVKEQHFTKE